MYNSRKAAKTVVSSGGIGFGGLLAILFIGLKLGGVITWPWVWVLSPLWIPFVIALVFLTIGLVIYALAAFVVWFVLTKHHFDGQ